MEIITAGKSNQRLHKEQKREITMTKDDVDTLIYVCCRQDVASSFTQCALEENQEAMQLLLLGQVGQEQVLL